MTSTSAFEAVALRRRLSDVPFLSALDESSLSVLETELEWLSVPGGCTLFNEEEVADALYVVITGCLGVTVRSGDGQDVLVARARAGETIGEMALLGGETRSATVIAIRDTEVLRLGRVSYERLVKRHPRLMLPLLSLLVQRLRNTTHRADPAARIRTLALVPMGSDERHIQFARDLADELAVGGQRVRLLDSKVADNTTEWFNAAETSSDLVVYHAEPADSVWTKLCLRQADRVLLMAMGDTMVQVPAWVAGDAKDCRRPFDLALLHSSSSGAPKSLKHWREQLPIDFLCHVRHGNANDLARLGRLLTGKAVGLVLGSGGARGFAHLGVIRALREAHIPIDLIGGCSMGAIIGAGVALEWDDAEMRERLRRAFVASNPINDYALPFIALTRGRKVAGRLHEHFGSIRIDDLWRPYFCVSTNLTMGTMAVHRDGPLVQALRASVAIPGLMPPVLMEGAAHVDGGMMNCLPVDVMSSMRRGRVIAVDVASDPALGSLGEGNGPSSVWHFLRHGRKVPPIVDLLVRAGTVSSDALARRAREQADVLFKPPLETVDLLDWQACDYAIGVGYRHAIGQLEHADKSGLSAPW